MNPSEAYSHSVAMTEQRTASIKQIPLHTLTQPQCFQITESLFKQMIPVITLHCLLPNPLLFFSSFLSVLLPFFSLCVGMFGPGSSVLI